jgi:trigger factor
MLLKWFSSTEFFLRMSKLKIETTPRDDHQVRLVAEFEQEQFDKYKHQAARKISKDTKIPGFRPGKAPYDVVRRMMGEKAIAEQAMDLLIDEVYPEIIKESDIHPYGPGSLDEIVKMEPPTLAFLVPLEPSVELGDYRSVRIPYEPTLISEKDVDDSIDRLRTSSATVELADRPAGNNDLVYLNVHGRLTHPTEGEDAEVFKDAPTQVWIRSEEEQKKGEWPYPGFAREMLDVSAGEDKILLHTFAEDSADESLRGREVEFHAYIESVKAMKLPELDEEFIHKLGDFKTVDETRANMRERLEHNAKDEYDEDYFNQLTDKIRETAKLEYPPQAIKDESETVLDNINQDLARQNLDFESYLKIRQMDKDTFVEKEIKPVAVKRLERALILDAIGKIEQLKVDVEEVTNMVSRTISAMQRSGELKRYRGRMSEDQFTNALAMDAAARTMNHQVLEKLKAIATGTEEILTVESIAVESIAADMASVSEEGSVSDVSAPPDVTTASDVTVSPDEEPSSTENQG